MNTIGSARQAAVPQTATSGAGDSVTLSHAARRAAGAKEFTPPGHLVINYGRAKKADSYEQGPQDGARDNRYARPAAVSASQAKAAFEAAIAEERQGERRAKLPVRLAADDSPARPGMAEMITAEQLAPSNTIVNAPTTDARTIAAGPTATKSTTATTTANSSTSTQIAAKLVASSAYYLNQNGTKSSLTTTQKSAMITQLAAFTPAELTRLQSGGVKYAVMDPAKPPTGVTWPSGAGAFYDATKKTVYIDRSNMNNLIIHESVHALDNLKATAPSTWSSTDSATMKQAYTDYVVRTAVTPSTDWDAAYNRYAAKNLLEFTAEAGRMYLQNPSTRTTLQQKDPETYAAIQGFLNFLSV